MSDNRHPLHPTHGGHETRDINVRKVLYVGAGVLVMTALAMLVALWVFNYLDAREAREDLPVPDFAANPPLPPEPRLQVTPTQDLQAILSGEDADLRTYGWVDKQQGVVHIPIDRAMQLVVERGLPARTAPAR